MSTGSLEFTRARVVPVGDIAADVDPRISPPAVHAPGVVDVQAMGSSRWGPLGHSVCLRFLDGTTEVITMTCGFRVWAWDDGSKRWCALAIATQAESSVVYESSVVSRLWVQLLTAANIGSAQVVEIWIGPRAFV